jgi:hypothetical protein
MRDEILHELGRRPCADGFGFADLLDSAHRIHCSALRKYLAFNYFLV